MLPQPYPGSFAEVFEHHEAIHGMPVHPGLARHIVRLSREHGETTQTSGSDNSVGVGEGGETTGTVSVIDELVHDTPVMLRHAKPESHTTVSETEQYPDGWGEIYVDGKRSVLVEHAHAPGFRARRQERAEALVHADPTAATTKQLLREGLGDWALMKLPDLEVSSQQAAAEELAQHGYSAAYIFEGLPGVTDRDAIGWLLMENGDRDSFMSYLDRFTDRDAFVRALMDTSKVIEELDAAQERGEELTIADMARPARHAKEMGNKLMQLGEYMTIDEYPFDVQIVADGMIQAGGVVEFSNYLYSGQTRSMIRNLETRTLQAIAAGGLSHATFKHVTPSMHELSAITECFKPEAIRPTIMGLVRNPPPDETNFYGDLEPALDFSGIDTFLRDSDAGFTHDDKADVARTLAAKNLRVLYDNTMLLGEAGVLDHEVLATGLETAARSPGPFAAEDRQRLIDTLNYFTPQAQHAAELSRELLAGEVNPALVRIMGWLQQDTVSDELRSAGITRTGQAGEQQLRELVSGFRHDLCQVEIDDDQLRSMLQDPLKMAVFKATVRYDDATFGSHDTSKLAGTVEYYLDSKQCGDWQPMPEGYEPGEIVHIPLAKEKEKIDWTEDTLARYKQLREEIVQAYLAVTAGTGRQGTEALIGHVRQGVERVVSRLETQLQAGTNPRTGEPLAERERQNMERRYGQLKALITPDTDKPGREPLRSVRDFENNFKLLAVNKELHPAIRRFIFGWALRRHAGVIDGQPLGKNPGTADVSTLVEFVDHIVNQETFKQYFTDKKAASMFRDMVNTKALQEGLMRAHGEGISKDTMAMQFVPTRGVMMELSGHIADACWASKYESIAEERPNMTAVIMKQRPGTPAERLAGSAMLIETHDKNTGEPVLLIRGLNPLENTITKLSPDEFYRSFEAYARGIAQKRGMKLALTVDDHIGGAATNRPLLFHPIRNKSWVSKQIRVPADEVDFNGYGVDDASSSKFRVYEV